MPAQTDTVARSPPDRRGGGKRAGDSQPVVEPVSPPTHASRSGAMLGWFVRSAVAFLKEESGPTAVEYAVMLALILVVIFAAVANIGNTTSDMYNNLSLQGVK